MIMQKHRKISALFSFLPATAIVLSLSVTPTYAVGTTVCTGTLSSGTYQNIKVPTGATCTLNDVTVNGNIKGQAGASLIMSSSVVNGNVKLKSPATIGIGGPPLTGPIIGNTIRGNLYIKGATSDVLIADNTINGNVKVRKASGPSVVVGENAQNRIKGNLNVSNNNSPFGRVTGNVVNGNLKGLNNKIASNSFSNNNVGGNMKYNSNVGSNGIYTNNVAARLVCFSNSTAPFGGGNIAAVKLGQCSSL